MIHRTGGTRRRRSFIPSEGVHADRAEFPAVAKGYRDTSFTDYQLRSGGRVEKTEFLNGHERRQTEPARLRRKSGYIEPIV